MGRAKAPRETRMKTWIMRNKINRYRGILKLHARDKELQLSRIAKLKSIVSGKFASLESDVKRCREIIHNFSDGDKQRILMLISDDREFYLAFNRLRPSEIHSVLYHNSNAKRQLRDKLYYKKQGRLKRMLELQLERNTCSHDYGEESDNLSDCEQQQLIARLQQYIMKYNSAKTIHFTYCLMLNVLKKDAIFFDSLLNILKEDQFSQCNMMLRITMMGQLAVENLDDVRQKYKRWTHVILQNMKTREHMLSIARCHVQDLWSYIQSLIRMESDTVFTIKDTNNKSTADKILENQLMHLKDICTQVKETLLVRSYHNLLSRLENQFEQKTNLLERLNDNIKNRDSLLNQKNYALHVLESLKHSTKIVTEQYKVNEHEISEQIEIEKKRKNDLKELKKTRGESLTNIRAALQSLNTMLFRLRQSGKGIKKTGKNGNKISSKVDDKEDAEERDALSELEEMDTDALTLLSKICRKVNILFGMSNFDLTTDKEDKARNLYQTYVSNYNSNLIFGSEEEETIGLFVEPEMVDVNIPTRADIKLRSKQKPITET